MLKPFVEFYDEQQEFEFDQLCTYRLLKHDNERDARNTNHLLEGISIMLGGKPSQKPTPQAETAERLV